MLAAACCFALGIAIARSWVPVAWLLLALLTLTLLTVVALVRAQRVLPLPLAALWILAGITAWQWHPVPSTQQELQRFADGLSRDVRGRVERVRVLPPRAPIANGDSDATWWQEHDPDSGNALSIDLAVEAVEEVTPDVSNMVPIDGGVRLTLLAQDAALPSLRCGDVVQLPLRLRTPQRYHDPGAWQYADYLLSQGIGTQATAKAEKLRILSHSRSGLHCRLFAAQQWAASRMLAFVHSPENKQLPAVLRLREEDAAMLNAMLFGDRTRLTQTLRQGFERTGSFHLFVVSGMHVALLGGMLLALLRRLRVRDGLATAITLPLLAGYALLTGFGAPVQRALFMTTIFLVARLLSRDSSVLNALGAAALAELLLSPLALFEASLQMTFLVVFAIAGIAVPLGERSITPWARASRRLGERWRDASLPPRLTQLRVMLRAFSEPLAALYGRWTYPLPGFIVSTTFWLLELALIGLVAEMVMALPMAIYFHRATPFALPANMLTIPIITLVAPLAILLFLTSLVAPILAVIPAAFTAGLLHLIRITIHGVGHLRAADLRVPEPALWVSLIAIALWALCLWSVRRSPRWALAALLLLPAGTIAVLWPEPPRLTHDRLEITAIDVGQGDSILVASPNGRTMLVDAGGPVGRGSELAAQSASFDIGEEIVSPYLWSRRIRRLDVLVLTHAHSDHMGGMPAVLRNLRPHELWVSVDAGLDAYRELLRQASELGVTVRHLHAGDALDWDGVHITTLSPTAGSIDHNAPTNGDSLVLRLDYGSASALLEGDAEASDEQVMLARGLAPVTLLKVGHHGSRTSTTQPFLDALQPRDAVVSVGRDNHFGHPRGEIIERLAHQGTRLYRTDEFGLSTFLLRRDGTADGHTTAQQP